MGFLLQITMSCWCCKLARGGYRLLMPVLVLGAGCRCWSWLCTWWRQVAGAGAVSWLRRVAVPVLHVVEVAGAGAGCPCWCWVLGAGAGAGAVSWLCTWWRGCWCRCWCWMPLWRCRKLAVQAVSTGRGILPSYLGLCWCNFRPGQHGEYKGDMDIHTHLAILLYRSKMLLRAPGIAWHRY